MNVLTSGNWETEGTVHGIRQGILTPIFHFSMFWTPQRQAPSAWVEHVPFAFWLVDVLRPSRIVELGTHNGVSYSAMCQAVKTLGFATSCFAIDTWKGDEHAGFYGEDVYQDFAAFHDQHYGAFSQLVRSTFDEALHYFEDGSIDLLHIDGLHTYEAMRHDYESWLPKLAANAVVLFHDINVRERDFGVFRLWNEITARAPHFSFLHGYGLGVLGRGQDYPDALRALFAAAEDVRLISTIRETFAALGRSVRISSEKLSLEQSLSERAREVGRLREALAARDDELANVKQRLSEGVSEITALRLALAVRDSELANIKERLSEVANEIGTLRLALAARDDELTKVKRRLSENASEIGTARQVLAIRDDELADVKQRLSEGASEVSTLTQIVTAQDDEIALLQQQLSERASETGALRQTLAAQAGQIEEFANRNALLNQILASHSWRLTRPLRLAGRLVRGEWSLVLAGLRDAMPNHFGNSRYLYGSPGNAILAAIRAFRRLDLPVHGLMPPDPVDVQGPKTSDSLGEACGPSVPQTIATSKTRHREEVSTRSRLWYFVGDSLDWLEVHKHLTGVGRVSAELYFATAAWHGGGRIHPCVLDRNGRTLSAVDPAKVMMRLQGKHAPGSASSSRGGRPGNVRDVRVLRPRPGDHVFFTGLVWTPTFTDLFAHLARDGVGFSVLLHDIIPLELPDAAESDSVHLFATWLTCVLQAADVVYVSNSIVEDQVRRWAVLAGVEIGAQLTMVEFGQREFPVPDGDILAAPKFASLRRENFVLSVGTIDKRKNQVHLCGTWQRLAKTSIGPSLPQLVLAGRDDLGLLDHRSVFADLIANGRVLVLEDLSDPEVGALYDACLFTAFPSTREGYGLPVSESLQHGKLCLASSLPVIRTHAGDLAWYFDVDDEAACDALFTKAIVDIEVRRAAEAEITVGFRRTRWSSTLAQMTESALAATVAPLPAIDFGPRRPEFPGAADYDTAEVLERASRWCTDRDPEVSILIINWNAAALTLECIRQIWARTQGHTYEIVIVDNGSNERDLRRLRNPGRGVRFLPNGCNRFFGEANNIAAEAARGKYLCLLNNDAFVQDGWLIHLIDALRRHPEVGAVGPMFLYPNGVVQEAGAAVDAGGYPVRFGRGEGRWQNCILTEKYSDYISAAALLLARDLFMEIGGFDLAYEPAYYEDTDLCFKIQALGKKVLYCPESKVIHIEGTSANSDPEAEARRKVLGDINRDKFVSRWGRYLRERDDQALVAARATLVPSRLGAAKPSSEKVAVVFTPYALTPGGGERYLLTWAQALTRDHHVLVVTPHAYSNLRLRNLAAELRLDLSGMQLVPEADVVSMPAPDLMVVMGNETLPPISPRGRVNFYHCQFPFARGGGETAAKDLQSYRAVVVNSQYTRRHYFEALKQARLPIADVRVAYPPVPRVEAGPVPKSPIILSVGRFFVGGHSKRQDLLIDAFKSLLDRTNQPLELHLAGSSMPQREHMDYLSRLRAKAEGFPIKFHVNVSYDLLSELYRRATVYWHGTGLGQHLAAAPGCAEHFGITLVEAMSAGAIPFAFDAGGPCEIIRSGECGFLYGSLERLVEETHLLFSRTSQEKRERLAASARRRAEDFSIQVFQSTVLALLTEFA